MTYLTQEGSPFSRFMAAVIVLGAATGAATALLSHQPKAILSITDNQYGEIKRSPDRSSSTRAEAFNKALSTYRSPDLRTKREALQWLRIEMDGYSNVDFEQAVKTLAGRRLNGIHLALFEALFEEWATRDPQAAVAAAEAMAPNLCLRALRPVLSGWLESDPVAARSWLKNFPHDAGKSNLIQHLFVTLGRDNLPGMLAIIEESQSPWSDMLKGMLFETGAPHNPLFVIERALNEQGSWWTNSALTSAIKALMESDPVAAHRYLNLSTPSTRGPLLAGILDYYSDNDPQKALDLASREWRALSEPSDFGAFDLSLEKKLTQAFGNDISKTLDWLALQPEGEFKQGITTALLKEASPEEQTKALQIFKQTDLLNEGNLQVFSTLIAQQLKSDFASGIQWIKENKELVSYKVQKVIIEQYLMDNMLITEDSYRKASALASLFPEGESLEKSTLQIATQWAYSQPEKLEKILMAAPKDAFREKIMSGMLSTYFMKDPAKGMERIDTLFTGPEREKQVIQGIRFTRTGFEKVLPWALKGMQGTPSKEFNETVARAVGRWSSYDAQGASQWITQQPSGPQRDLATASLATTIAKSDPQNAIDWAKNIRDDKQRLSTLEAVAKQWKRVDRDGAQEWIEASDFPPQIKERLLK